MKKLRRILLLVVVIALFGSVSVLSMTSSDRDYWPGEAWRTSTPEEQGMDSESIYKMLKYIQGRGDAHSILIIRNGYLVTEAYFDPYHREFQQIICSCTKSITSALIGIAIREGLIKDVHQKVLDFFPEYSFASISEAKKAMTIANLLTMSSGIDWTEDLTLSDNMLRADDAVQFVLDRAMIDEPGSRFLYNTGGSQLLSTIIFRNSGETTLEFARKQLFKPLRIAGAAWQTDKKEIHVGGAGLSLTPFDMAKLGYLYLRKGVWDGKQVIPADWVEASTKSRIKFNPFPNTSIGYGYHWWVESFGFAAQGWGGQSIYVIPQLDLVVVFTNGKPNTAYNLDLSSMVEMYLLPAVKSEKPLAPDSKKANQLKKWLQEIETPKAQRIPPLPKMVAQISGKVFELEANQFEARSFSLRFGSKNSCFLKVTWSDGSSFEYPVGLDGIYRTVVTETLGTEAMKGAWLSENQFLVNWQVILYSERYDLSFKFNGDQVVVEVSSSVTGSLQTIKGSRCSL